ncbi:MAG: ABC transporter substrate-binding protein [Trueperella sp.]|nr:ABC transporter substrate-binding protein [Trueperella sp.]
MKKISRLFAATAVAALAIGGLAACSSSDDNGGNDAAGSVYYLNFKPESEDAWKKVAQAYTDETGVQVKIVTAASGTYEQTLKSELATKEAPTMFNLNGPVGLANWQDYSADLTDTDFTKALSNPDLALKGADDKVYGVPFATEGYGIIYNDAIMQKYFALDGAKATAIADINNFDALKAVAEDMQARKAELGIDGAFAATSLASGEDWRWQTHLANYPIFYEFRDAGVSDATEIKGTYFDQFQQIFDLYLDNSTVSREATPSRTVTDSMADFALGKAAFVQNGNWAWSQISEVSGNTVKESDIHFLPIYVGVPGEEKAGIAVGTENFLTVNAKASEADQKATVDFINWLFTKDAGTKMVSEDLGFIAPFTAFQDLAPADPLGKEVVEYMNNADLYPVTWDFVVFPSQDFKDQLGQHMQQYAIGKQEWSAVKDYFISQWSAEKGK